VTMLTMAGTGTTLQHLEVAAAASAGTPGWLTALIAGLAAILAAAATALSSAYAAKRKIAEIELTNSFQMAEKYLESARQYTQNVYLPLAVAVHNLHAAFLNFKAVVEESEMPAARQRLSDDIAVFVAFADGQFKAGASATFTLKLDDTLTSFISFLEKSRSASDLVIAADVEMAYSVGYFGWKIQNSKTRRLTSSRRALLQPVNLNFALPLFPFGMTMKMKRIPTLAAAPLSSDDFAERFTMDVNQIKAAIKEVTLGAYRAPSGQ